ncbi:MAG: hypothetical protein ABIW84_07200 [Ilumatobacteraceae bacterium]
MVIPLGDVHAPKSESLRAMYWRSEILQVMFWLRGEGFGDLVDPPLIERFLGVDSAVGITYLNRLVEEGYLDRDCDWYTLSALGLVEGGTEFALSFDELMRPTHGECSDDCWCHMSADEADACVAHRRGHDHEPDHEHGGR